MKIVFLGASDFSASVFNALVAHCEVAAVVTPVDKAVGRKLELRPCDLKIAAENAGIKVLQYSKVSKEGIEDLKQINPDLCITAAFGQILSDEFLAIPRFGTLNVHASLLPKYRGASPIQAAILNGDAETGVTIMRTVHALDAGDVLMQRAVAVAPDATSGSMFDTLAALGGEMIVEAVDAVANGNAVFTPQQGWDGTYCRMIKKQDGKINFAKSARELDCFVRGMSPWPSAFCTLGDKMLKVFSIDKVCDCAYTEVGTIVQADSANGLCVQCGDGVVRLKVVQYEGSKRMSDLDFLRGYRNNLVGEVLK